MQTLIIFSTTCWTRTTPLKGTARFFTPRNDALVTKALNLEIQTDYYSCPTGLTIKSAVPIVDPKTLEAKGAIVVTFPVDVSFLQTIKQIVKSDITIQWNRGGDVISTLQDPEGKNLIKIWNTAHQDFDASSASIAHQREIISGSLYATAYSVLENNLGRNVGILSTVISLDAIEKSKKDTIKFLLISLGITLVLAVFLGLFTAVIFTKPLYDLLGAIKSLAKGRFDARARITRQDEFETLAKAFNDMAETIEDKQNKIVGYSNQLEEMNRQLENFNRKLESIVSKRTEDLEKANEKLNLEIKERILAAKALKESEQRFSVAFRSSPSAAAITLLEDGRFIDVNDSFTYLTGFERKEVLGRSALKTGIWAEPERRKNLVNELETHGSIRNAEYTFLRKSGEKFTCLFSSEIILIGDEPCLLSVFFDITERNRSQKALRESERKYRDLVENIRDVIYSVNPQGIITYVSPTIEPAFGYKPSEFIGKPFREILFQDDLPYPVNGFQEMISGFMEPKDYRMVKKSGELCWIRTSFKPIAERDQLIELRGILTDVSVQKTTEEENRRLQSQLQQARKMEAIGTLAGGVAHDLNNILSGIVSYPELLLMDLPADSPLKKPILTIKKSGEKAATIVQDLLTLARRGVSVTEVISLNRIINEYLKSPEWHTLKSYHPGVQIETSLERNLLPIEGSPVHLSKTLMNLVSNASEAMPYGGKVVVSTENIYMDAPVKGYDDIAEGDYVCLTVSDFGVGLSAEDRERIFEPFYTKKIMGRSGTGLGMAVVWGTVKDHQGYIDIQSSEGKGTTFNLYFPVTRKEQPLEQPPLTIDDLMGKGESVLIVDDVAEQRDIASRMLTKLNYRVSAASSGEEAIEYLQKNSADILVLDMIMDPGIDGLEAYQEIVTLKTVQKAVIASGFSETDRVKAAQKLGAGIYVKKPYTLEKLGLAVRKTLDKKTFP